MSHHPYCQFINPLFQGNGLTCIYCKRVQDYDEWRTENETNLRMLCSALGWQGGTIHQVIEEVKRLKEQSKESSVNKCIFHKIQDIHCKYCMDEHPKKEEVDERGGERRVDVF